MSEKTAAGKNAPIILDDPNQGVSYSQRKLLREKLKVWLNSVSWQWFIIALVICDALLVGTDIILSNVYCADEHPPHDVEVTEEVLRILSIIILSFFVLEWLVEAWVHGFRRWTRTVIHAADLGIVIISLALELTALLAHENTLEIGGLLVVFRLWRVVRVMHAVREVQHKRAHEQILTLKEANIKLFQMNKAHHAVVKGLHAEFVQRINAVRSARLEHLCKDPTANVPVVQEVQPSLHELLDSVSTHNTTLQQSVDLHRKSTHISEVVVSPVPISAFESLYVDGEGEVVPLSPELVDMQPQALSQVREESIGTGKQA